MGQFGPFIHMHLHIFCKIPSVCFFPCFALLFLFIIYYSIRYTNNPMLYSLTLNCLFQELIFVAQTLVIMETVQMERKYSTVLVTKVMKACTVKEVSLQTRLDQHTL